MTRLRGVLIRGLLLAGLAAALALATRDLLVRAVARRLEGAGDALADVTQQLPAPGRTLEVPLALPPVETVTLPALAGSTAPLSPPPLRTMVKAKAKPATTSTQLGGVVAPMRVTRAEVDAAIASKVFGTRTKLARDEAGKPIGLALYATGPLARFGVQDGDVLVSANGFSLRTPEDAFAAVGSLKEATRVTVVLRRGAGSYAVTVEVAPE